MSVSSYRSTVERLHRELAELERQIASKRDYMTRAQGEATRIMSSITNSTSLSTLQQKQRDIQRKNEEATRYQNEIAQLEKRKSDKYADLNRNLRYLEQAISNEKRSQDEKDKRRRDDEIRHARDITRELEKQLRTQQEMKRSKFSIDLTKLPEKAKILFLASNPVKEASLQLDEEIREIDRKIRMAEHRDGIELLSWWAARPLDLMQALNEKRPDILHFSGHGDEDGNLVFHGDNGGYKLVTPEAVATTIATVSREVRLIVFNACFSEIQAAMIVSHIPAAIGMRHPVGDVAAKIFAAQFYSSLGFGRSLQEAFEQGRSALMLEGTGEEDTPQLYLNPDLAANETYFVKP